jgi:hypothetical protein
MLQPVLVGNAYKGALVDAFVDDTTIQVWN